MVAMPRVDLIVILAWVAVLVVVLAGRAVLSWVAFRSLYRYRPTPPPAPAERPPAEVLPFRPRLSPDRTTTAPEPEPEELPVPAAAFAGTDPDR
jgi:hypothetical protein